MSDSNSKTCRKCDQLLPLTEYYAHRGSNAPRDGLQSYCKKCCSKGAMERAKTPQGREYQRRWKRQWLKTDKGRASQAKQAKAYKQRNPLKAKVRKFVSLAVELGVLVRPSECT